MQKAGLKIFVSVILIAAQLVPHIIAKLYTKVRFFFGETLFFYPVANTFSQTGCQIPNILGPDFV